MNRLITIKELSEYLQVTRQTIQNYMKGGMPYKKIGGNVRFDVEEVLKYFENKGD